MKKYIAEWELCATDVNHYEIRALHPKCLLFTVRILIYEHECEIKYQALNINSAASSLLMRFPSSKKHIESLMPLCRKQVMHLIVRTFVV